MEQRLLQDLHERLGDLDHKVRAYRHNMVAAFESYYQQVLRDVDPAIALAVEQSLATSVLSQYPALAPELQPRFGKHVVTGESQQQGDQGDQGDQNEHCAPRTTTATTDSRQAAESPRTAAELPVADSDRHHPSAPPPPPLGAEDGAAVDLLAVGSGASSGSAREHEREFQGLFTPFFLPLLESPPVLPSSPPPPPLPAAASPSFAEPVTAGTGIGSGIGAHVATADQLQGAPRHLQGQDMEGSGETGPRQGRSPPASPPHIRPGSARRSTDTSSSSALSDKSDTKVPRSALRRSSSTSKPPHPSPRRVRFEFRGTEVLPTASPQPSDFPTPRPSSPVTADHPATFDEIVGDSGCNKGDPAEEEQLPPPRKISSSEALRALSRAPLDEGTVWTVVNSGADEGVDRKGSSPPVSATASGTATATTTTSTSAPAPAATSSQSSVTRQLVATQRIPQIPQIPQRPKQEELDESSDEEFLAMATPKSFKNKKSIQSTTTPRSPDKTSQTGTASSSEIVPPRRQDEDKDQTSSEEFDGEEDLFQFDAGGLSAPPRPRRRPPPLKEEILEVSEPPSSGADIEPVKSPQATSSAVPITRPSESPGPSTPTATKFQIGSLGSYKGRPVVMPVVKNPEVLAQAASLGEFNTFVGSLDGRSGVDEGDLNSFRATLAQSAFSGTPRSLTERMMMEDAQAERGTGR